MYTWGEKCIKRFSLSPFKIICEAIEIYSDHGDGWFDRNLTTFHLCWTKVFATHLYPHKIMAYQPFYERPSHNQLVRELLWVIW